MIRDILKDIVGSHELADSIILGLSRRGYIVAPRTPTDDMVAAGVNHRMTTGIDRTNTWVFDTVTLYGKMLEERPK